MLRRQADILSEKIRRYDHARKIERLYQDRTQAEYDDMAQYRAWFWRINKILYPPVKGKKVVGDSPELTEALRRIREEFGIK